MHLKNWLSVLALVAVSSCSAIRKDFPPPDIDLGVAIWNGSTETSYGYFTPYFYESRKSYRQPSEQMFREKVFLIKASHFGALEKYVGDLESQISKRCK